MPKAEGKTFKVWPESAIKTNCLEAFFFKGFKQLIEITSTEFSALCPFSGLPDYAKLIIKYIPHNKCLELKSLKYYLVSFRNVGIYQEAATNRIYKDLNSILKPRKLFVQTIYNIRGGLGVTCTSGEI